MDDIQHEKEIDKLQYKIEELEDNLQKAEKRIEELEDVLGDIRYYANSIKL